MGDNHGYPNYCRNWMSIAHQTLYDEIHNGPGPSAMQGTRDTYSQVAALFAEVEGDIQTGLAQIGASYEGSGSEAAQSGIAVLRQWTGDAQVGSGIANNAVSTQTMAYSGARMAMPEPVEVTAQDSIIDQISDFFGGTTPREEQEAAALEAHLEAARVMSTYDITTFNSVTAMPAWVPPPSIAVDVPTPTPTTTSINSTSTEASPVGTSAASTTPTGTSAPPTVSAPPTIPGSGPTTPAGPTSPPGGTAPSPPPPPVSGGPAPTPGAGGPAPSPAPLPPPVTGPGGAPPPAGTGPAVPPVTAIPPTTGGGGRLPTSGGGRLPTGGTSPITGPGTSSPGTGPGGVRQPTGGLPGGTGARPPGGGYPGGMYPPGAGGGAGRGDYERGASRYGRGAGGFGPSGFVDPDGSGARAAGPRGSFGAAGTEGFGPRGSAGAGGAGGYGAAGRGGALAGRGAGAAGGGIMGPAAAGAQREDDGEHKRKYQVASDEYFADDRLVPPPVIGEIPHG